MISVAITDPYAAVKFYHDWIAANTIYTLDTNYNMRKAFFHMDKVPALDILLLLNFNGLWSELIRKQVSNVKLLME
jgi:hypothetical protein